MSLSELYKLNNLEDFDTITEGQEVVVGYKDKVTAETSREQVTINDTNTTSSSYAVEESYDKSKKYHTVKTGETLYRVSKNYNISIDELKRLNSLTSNTIFIGQKIIVR